MRTGPSTVTRLFGKLRGILAIPAYRRGTMAIAFIYLILFLVALQDISLGGQGFDLVTVEWTRMFDRTTTFTFEAVARVTVPGVTILLSPVNFAIGVVLAVLAGLNLVITWIAIRQPAACSFNRSTGFLASIPALLAGSACCAPAIVLILGLQMSSLLLGAFQVLIPASLLLLILTLILILRRTQPELLAGRADAGTRPPARRLGRA